MSRAAWFAATLCLLAGLLDRDVTVERHIDARQVLAIGGHQYFVPLERLGPTGFEVHGDTNPSPRQSTLALFEGERPLGPAHSLHESIRRDGRGAYSHWGDGLQFSSSDNSDPRDNGVTYRVTALAVPNGLTRGLVWTSVTIGAWLALTLLLREWTTAAKLVAFGWVLGLAPRAWTADLGAPLEALRLTGRYGLAAWVVATTVGAVAAIALTPFVTSALARTIASVVLLSAFLLDQALLAVAGQHLQPDLVALFISERDMADTVVPAYLPALGPLLVAGAALLAAFLLPVRRWPLHTSVMLVPVLAVATAFGVRLAAPALPLHLPAPVGVPAMFLAGLLPRAPDTTARQPVTYARALTPKIRNLVVVIDESVRGDTMGINDRRHGNTPFLSGLTEGLINFGVATSATNCSVASRVIMRIGLRPQQLPDVAGVARRQPTIWQYAETAGFRTTLLDGWGRLHSYMDEAEFAQVDDFLNVEGEEHERDQRMPALIEARLGGPRPAFVYVNKLGIHPDYALKVPPDVTDTPSFPAPDPSLDERRRADIGDYHRALRHSVDAFFADLWPRLPDDTAVVYTSDHGQSLYEGGYDLTHCSLTPDAHRGELRVPLFVLTKNVALQRSLATAAATLRDQADHYALFSTLLQLMGYAADWADHTYGRSLWTMQPGPRRFLLGTYNAPGALWVDY